MFLKELKKFGFTLSEVLITIGVIGVIAALTLPALIKNYQKHVTLNKLKVTYTTLNNALERAKADYGTDVNSWYIPYSNNNKEKSDYFAENYLIPYLKIVKDCNPPADSCTLYANYLNGTERYVKPSNIYRNFAIANGSFISVIVGKVSSTEDEYTSRVQIYMFLNGKKDNSTMGKDVFIIELGGIAGSGGNLNKFLPYGYSSNRNNIISGNGNTFCSKESSGAKCFALIMYDGWKISDDYPW